MTVITRLNMQFELMHVSAFNNYNTFSSDIFYNFFSWFIAMGGFNIQTKTIFKYWLQYINEFSANNTFDGISCYAYKKMTHWFEISLFSTQKSMKPAHDQRMMMH